MFPMILQSPIDLIIIEHTNSFNFKEVSTNFFEVIKEGGVLILFGSDDSFSDVLYLKESGFRLHDTMVRLFKKDCLEETAKDRYIQSFEFMFIFSKGKPKTFNPIMDRRNRKAGSKISGKQRDKIGNFIAARNIGNIIKPFGVRFNWWNDSENIINDLKRTWSNEEDEVILLRRTNEN